MKKIPGVQSVTVSLNEGSAKIQLKPENIVSLDQLREAVEDNGFTAREARVTAEGTVVSTAGKLALQVTGLKQTYELSVDPKAQITKADLEKLVGKEATVQGVIRPPKDKKAVDVLQVTGLKTT